MSLRVYSIFELLTDTASSNLWRDHELMQIIDDEADLSDSVGLSQVPAKLIEQAARIASESGARFKSKKDNVITYYCF